MPMEPNIYGLWVGKQTAKGTENTTPSKRLAQVGGDFNIARDDGNENWSDLTKYGGNTDWINSLVGNGNPAVEATPTEMAYLLWLAHGAEVVTAVTGPPAAQKHTFTPQLAQGHWCTFVKRIGTTVVQRQSFIDCLIGGFTIEGSTANKAVRITPNVLSLDPGKVVASDPAAALPTDKAFLYTEATGTFTIDSVVVQGQSQFTFTVNEDRSPVYGDDAVPYDLAVGQPSVTIGVTVIFDAVGLARYNTLVYGTACPATGAKPIRNIPALGSYSAYFKQKDNTGALTGREFKLTIPGVKWAVPDAPGPNPDGGNTEVALAGSMRPLGGATQPYTIDVSTSNTDVAFTT